MWKTWTGSPDASPISSPGGASGGVSAPGGWHPTVLYLVGLLIIEMAAVAFIARKLR